MASERRRELDRIAWQKDYAENPEKYRERCRLWREANKEHRKEYMQRWELEHRDHRRKYARDKQLAKYGLTLEAFNALLLAQDNRCAICHTDEVGGPNETFAIDHCHLIGRVRGLLCNRCNTSIGKFEDNPDLLRAAASYLEDI